MRRGWLVGLMAVCASVGTSKPDAPPMAPRGARPLPEVRMDVTLGQPAWAGARCASYPRWFRNGMWGEWAERVPALPAGPARDALGAVLRAAESREGVPVDAVERLRSAVGGCTTCAEAELVGRLVLALRAEPPEVARAAGLGADGLARFPESAFAPMFLRPLVHTPDGRSRLLDVVGEGGRQGDEAALLLACDEDFIRSADAASLGRITALPAHPETLPLPIASRWLALGQPEQAATWLDRAGVWVDRPGDQPECANEPSARPPEACLALVDDAHALIATLPVGTRPAWEAHLEVQVRRAVQACAPDACGDVQGSLANGTWAWTGGDAAFQACVREGATSVGWDVPRASITVRSGRPCP